MKRIVFKYIIILTISFCAGIAGAFAFYSFVIKQDFISLETQQTQFPTREMLFTAYNINPAASAFTDFVKASDQSRSSVVFIRSQSTIQQENHFGWDPFFDFFGNRGPATSTGSGVIISSDGYIVTNHHVVNKSEKIEVVLNNNKRVFPAKIIGSDPSTDLALLKISTNELPKIAFSNSDELKIGEWVLAVGNPFNLTSSVTAGIVSAKGRNINIVQNQFPIESFIQTDAAINPGNSGGALVNTEGQLVGINTAILSKTGSYAGYGFAIPSNIVKKVVSDLIEFGYVQRAFIEADIVDIDENLASKLDDDNLNGVYVRVIVPGGNADKGGLEKGDIIIKIDNRFIDSRAVFDEQLAYHRPGDKINLVIKRNGKPHEITITLNNQRGTTTLERNKSLKSEPLGAEFEEITRLEKEKYGVTNGIRIFNIGNGQIRRMNIPEGFIITAFNRKPYNDPQELIKAFESASGSIEIDGINPNGTQGRYSFYFY
jgi:serine protease Do